jgi:hypothetical protein
MGETVYILCAVTSVFCAYLLIRQYRKQRTQLLLASTLCFVGLAINNVMLLVDLVLVPDIDLSLLRSVVTLASALALVIGLIWESR